MNHFLCQPNYFSKGVSYLISRVFMHNYNPRAFEFPEPESQTWAQFGENSTNMPKPIYHYKPRKQRLTNHLKQPIMLLAIQSLVRVPRTQTPAWANSGDFSPEFPEDHNYYPNIK